MEWTKTEKELPRDGQLVLGFWDFYGIELVRHWEAEGWRHPWDCYEVDPPTCWAVVTPPSTCAACRFWDEACQKSRSFPWHHHVSFGAGDVCGEWEPRGYRSWRKD